MFLKTLTSLFYLVQFIHSNGRSSIFYFISSFQKSLMQETLPHSWLSEIDDEASVADISFPGTHDSAAF